MAITSKAVLKAIGCEYLSLYRGQGYWYFVFDTLDHGAKVYETESVMTMRLADLPLESWVSTGRDFVAKVKADHAEALENLEK